MAMCVTLQADGTLVPTGQAVSDCAGYVLVSGSEYGVFQVVEQALGMPTTEQAAAWFTGTFSAVLLCFIAGRLAGSVATFFGK